MKNKKWFDYGVEVGREQVAIPESKLDEFVEKWRYTLFYTSMMERDVRKMLKEYDELREGK
jgi:hypothetical protein